MRASPGAAPRLFRTSSSTRASPFPSSSTKALATRREPSSFRFAWVFIDLPSVSLLWLGGLTKIRPVGPTVYCVRSDQKIRRPYAFCQGKTAGFHGPPVASAGGDERKAGAPAWAGLASCWRNEKGAAAHETRNPLEVTGWQGPSPRAPP